MPTPNGKSDTARSDRPRLRRRLALAGLLGAAVIGSGAGFAYANGASSEIVETGFATVAEGTAAESAADCPDRSGGTTGDATPDAPSDAPSDAATDSTGGL